MYSNKNKITVVTCSNYIARNAQVSVRRLQACCLEVIRMRSYRLFQLDDSDKFAAGCQQACCKLIVKTFYPQT